MFCSLYLSFFEKINHTVACFHKSGHNTKLRKKETEVFSDKYCDLNSNPQKPCEAPLSITSLCNHIMSLQGYRRQNKASYQDCQLLFMAEVGVLVDSF